MPIEPWGSSHLLTNAGVQGVLVSVCCSDETLLPKAPLGRKGFISAYTSRSQSIIEGNQAGTQAKVEAETVEERFLLAG